MNYVLSKSDKQQTAWFCTVVSYFLLVSNTRSRHRAVTVVIVLSMTFTSLNCSIYIIEIKIHRLLYCWNFLTGKSKKIFFPHPKGHMFFSFRNFSDQNLTQLLCSKLKFLLAQHLCSKLKFLLAQHLCSKFLLAQHLCSKFLLAHHLCSKFLLAPNLTSPTFKA